MKISKEFMKPFNGRLETKKTKMTEEEKVKKATPLSPKHQCVYYVYQCYVEGDLKYIGMGKGNRIDHCTSGKSSCSELNRDFHLGKLLTVEKVQEGLTKQQATELEIELIWANEGKGIYNKLMHVNNASQPMISKVTGIVLNEKPKAEELYKQLAKISPNINEYNFQNLAHWLNRCGLNMYVVDIGSTKTLVLDKPFNKAFDYLHLGCPNFPCCDVNGCGG